MTTTLTVCFFFFFNDTATTEIYTLSLHDALPILLRVENVVKHFPVLSGKLFHRGGRDVVHAVEGVSLDVRRGQTLGDRKSTRLNSSHSQISYAVFCLKKKKNARMNRTAGSGDNTD